MDPTVWVAIITTVGVLGAATIAAAASIHVQLVRLRRENNDQHARADVAREAYRRDRERDHDQVVEILDRARNRIDRLEGMLMSHVQWEEGEKYVDIVRTHAELVGRITRAAEDRPELAELLLPEEPS